MARRYRSSSSKPSFDVYEADLVRAKEGRLELVRKKFVLIDEVRASEVIDADVIDAIRDKGYSVRSSDMIPIVFRVSNIPAPHNVLVEAAKMTLNELLTDENIEKTINYINSSRWNVRDKKERVKEWLKDIEAYDYRDITRDMLEKTCEKNERGHWTCKGVLARGSEPPVYMEFVLSKPRNVGYVTSAEELANPRNIRVYVQLETWVRLLSRYDNLDKAVMIATPRALATTTLSSALGLGRRSGGAHQVAVDAEEIVNNLGF